MNVYEYAASSPAVRVDPQGLLPHNGLGPPFCPGCNERNGGRMVDMMPEFDPSKLKGPYQKAIWATACIMALAEEILAILPQKKHREPSEDVNPELRSGNPRPRHNKPWYRDFVDGLLDWLENPYPL